VGLSAAGVLRLEPTGTVTAGTAVLLFPDGTRIQHGATGTLLISREGHPEVSISREEQRVVVKAYFADGLVVETTPQELDPSTEDMVPTFALESLHAFVKLQHPSGSVLRSLGDGEVEIIPAARAKDTVTPTLSGIAVAQCARNYVTATDASGAKVIATGVADLDIDGHDLPSPRCRIPDKGYMQEGPSPVPDPNSEPRLFVVYGDGTAEEWMSPTRAQTALETAREVDAWKNANEPKGLGCTVHTAFRSCTSMPKTGRALPGLAIPAVLSGLSCPPADPQTLLGTEFWKARALLEYPGVDEKKASEIVGALEWYEYYEYLANLPPIDEKEKKRQAKAAAKAAKSKKKKKVEEEVVPVKLPTGRKFTPYELELETLQLRAATRARTDPSVQEMISTAVAAKAKERPATAPEFEEELGGVPLGEEPSEYVPIDEQSATGAFAGQASMLSDQLPAARRADFPIPKAQIPTFQYFWSELGLGWLMDSGEIDRKPFESKGPPVPAIDMPPLSNAWNPMTVDELAEEETKAWREMEAEQAAMMAARRAEMEAARAYAEEQQILVQRHEQPISDWERQLPEVGPDPADPYGNGYLGRLVRTEDVQIQRPSSPPGPHPDKKSVKYDVYGEYRPVPPPAPKAFLAPNEQFLEVEAETDRRVRTSSVVLKKNALLAPSVQQVRRAGLHVLKGLSETRGVGAVQDADVQPRDPQMTATMQGLGDSNCLIEVQPGAIRFGALRAGGVYRLPVFLKNLDVDVTRYTIKPLEEPYLKLWYAHTPLAPGMSVKVIIELIAHGPVKIDTFLDVRVKAHTVKVPIQARVLEAEEYDSLETESLRLHGRKLVKRGVELVVDETYARKALGPNFAPPIDHLGESTSLDF